MSVENAIAAVPAQTAPGPDTPSAIRVVDLYKSFRIPTHRIDSLKERAVRPFASPEYRELRALDGVSFEVRQGEFFGIVGRNGCGKSTLLKLLASIYRADSGTIEIAGRMAPFIELGVGFNHELTARENVILNGVMMGLTPKEMRRRLDAVIDFAELREFADLKLKNYSSGMLVRLAFSVMMEAEADVLLIDEVLAVGDAAFQQKCADAFHQMKQEGKTIVLVTHEMGAVEAYCHRAMLLNDGRVEHIGEPPETGRRYLKLNFAREHDGRSATPDRLGETELPAAAEESADGTPRTFKEEELASGEGARIISCRILDEKGQDQPTLELGEPIRIEVHIELLRKDPGLHVALVLANADDISLCEVGILVQSSDGADIRGDRVTVTATVENPLAPGRHFVHVGLQNPFGISVFEARAASFIVFGRKPAYGLISPQFDYEVEIEGESQP